MAEYIDMIVNMNTRFQIASICFFVVLLVNYSRYRKVSLKSTRLYKLLLSVVTVELLFDMITVITVNNPDKVSALLNRFCHQMFIGSMDLAIFLVYLYLRDQAHTEARTKTWKKILIMTPLILSEAEVVFGSLYYKVTPYGNYSYGPMADTVYISVAIYLLLILSTLFRYRSKTDKWKRRTIINCVLLWVAAAVIQALIPYYLVSSIAVTMMLYSLYYAFENPKDNIDSKTGCFNKEAFRRMMIECLAHRKSFIVVNIVLYDIEKVYKCYGHEFGHRYLSLLGAELRQIFGTGVFRSKGDTLSVFFVDPDESSLDKRLYAVRELLKASISIGDIEISGKEHIDVIKCPQYADSVDRILNIIEFMAEQAPSHDAEIIRIDETFIEKLERRSTIEHMLELAIANDGFKIFYQPIWHSDTGRYQSAEALLRFSDVVTLGVVSPEEFIPIAERKGMIKQIGEMVFTKVCKFIHDNDIGKYGVDFIEVNLSGVQCVDRRLSSRFLMIMEENGVRPDQIDLEVTETAAIAGTEALLGNIEQLSAKGVSFAMDDFGTGFSNIAMIANVPYDYIKFDKSLVWMAFENVPDEKKVGMLEDMIRLIVRFGKKIIAEGIETREMQDFLIKNGVSHFQGYYHSRPVPGEEYLRFVGARNGMN